MKKILIPIFIFLAFAIGFLIFITSLSYSRIQYEKDTLAHVMDVDSGGELVAEYNGETTKVLGQNVYRIKSSITVTERERLFSKPKYNSDEVITLKFSDGATYIVVQDDSENDSVFIIYNYKGKNLYLKIEGYNSFSWVKRAISPQGIFNENIVIQ